MNEKLLIRWRAPEQALRVEVLLEEVFSITEKATALMEQWKPREG